MERTGDARSYHSSQLVLVSLVKAISMVKAVSAVKAVGAVKAVSIVTAVSMVMAVRLHIKTLRWAVGRALVDSHHTVTFITQHVDNVLYVAW